MISVCVAAWQPLQSMPEYIVIDENIKGNDSGGMQGNVHVAVLEFEYRSYLSH